MDLTNNNTLQLVLAEATAMGWRDLNAGRKAVKEDQLMANLASKFNSYLRSRRGHARLLLAAYRTAYRADEFNRMVARLDAAKAAAPAA